MAYRVKMKSLRLRFLLCLFAIAVAFTSAQTSNPITFRLEEEQRAETLIGNVATESGLRTNMTPEAFENLRYQILSADSLRITSLITINSRTGELFTNAMIDREQVCDSPSVTCRLEFDVTVKSDLNVIKLLNVRVEILDKNDNPPTFASRIFPLTILEDSPEGSEFPISGAVDRDSGLQASISYWMDDSDIFGLRVEQQIDASVLYLSLNQKLDRETLDSYQLNIYAKDGNTSASLTGTLSVMITVGDANDHDPEFTKPTYNFTVKENAAPRSFVGKLEAKDHDIGSNGQIQYNFSSLTSSRILELFRLDPNTGEIFVKSTLLYESNQEFRAVVQAKDKGETPTASQANLIISVVDAGNTPPRLLLTLAEMMYQDTTLLSEGLPVGSFVGTLKYIDNDSGQNGRVECYSLNDNFELQSIDDSGYGIQIKTKLNREFESEMNVQLECSDRGTPSLSADVNFTVLVGDTNDEHPVFAPAIYTGSVSERVTQVNNIVQVSATDRDEGDNAKVTYQLTTNSSNAFSVDPFSGWISLKSVVDRESEPVIRLIVLAIDGGDEPNTGSAIVSITVEDVNDNAPEIVRTEYSVKENEASGTFVSQIKALDRDDGVNGEVLFTLLSDPANSFDVSKTGRITTNAELDRESIPLYLIVVEAKDKGTPALSTTSTLSIFVTDTNDHAPVISFPISGNDSITISANLSPGSLVAKVMASDEDVGKNSRLMYLIAEGNPHKVFSIDNATGTVFVANRLTSVRQSSYHLTISVQDGGNRRQHSKTILHVKIDFTNATMYDSATQMEHKYVIIAGVISGITVVIAVVVIAIILKLRHAERGQSSHSHGKYKADNRSGDICKGVTTDYTAQTVPGFKVDQTDREAGFDPNKANTKESSTSSFTHPVGNGKLTYCNRSAMTQEYVNKHANSVFPAPTEAGRHRLTSEDIHSNTSAETTTSDSGRGASDAEETPNTVLPPQSFRPAPHQVPTIPPREPFTVATATNSTGSTFQVLSPYNRDLQRPGDYLSRAARAYASHKELDKAKRPVGKVRFSFDDNSVGNSRMSQPSPSQLKASSPIEMNIKPSSLPGAHGNALNDLSYSSGFSSAPSTRSADGERRFGDRDTTRGRHFNSSGKPQYRHDGVQIPRDPHRISQSAGGIPVHRGTPGNPRSSVQPNLFSKQSGSNFTSKDSSYPLLRPPLHSRSALSSLNQSVDEEDDDGSTTTSGSYAIDENLNVSVEC